MKVSKVVMIVVALHVLVIGGIFVFEGCTRAKTQSPALAEGEAPADQTNTVAADATALPAATSLAPGQTGMTPATVTPVAPAPVAKTYAVKKGDSLAKIAKSQGTTVVELAKANNLTKTSILKINQKLTIPVKAEVAPTQVAAAMPTTGIATPVEAAASAAAVSGSSYAVKSGDSLWKIAKAHNVSVTSLKQANSLTSDALKVNQKLMIPAATATTATTPMQAGISTASYDTWQPGTHTENGQTFHIVNINESPAAIAKQYGVKVDELMKANNISDIKRIQVGQKLVIPTTTAPATTATPAMAAPMVSAAN